MGPLNSYMTSSFKLVVEMWSKLACAFYAVKNRQSGWKAALNG